MPFDHFSAIAPLYARAHYSSLDILLKLSRLPARGRLLDVGGGTGRVSCLLREYVDEVVVADVSMGMLKQAPLSTLEPACCASEVLPFPDNSFDRIIMVDALHHVIHQAQTTREMFRVLKLGGLIVIEEPDIRTFGVKLIALAEKLLLMRSHFLSPQQIADLFESATTYKEDSSAWIVVMKQ
jgi:ubiquinone/menaquinone biosynthesis C-methylase UbiE